MKILYVFPRIPFPVSDGGAKAMADTISLFHRSGFELTFAGFQSELHPQSTEELSKFGKDSTVPGMFKPYGFLDAVKGIFGRLPIQIQSRMRLSQFQKSVKDLVGKDFDILFLDMVHVAHFIPLLRNLFPKSRIIVRTHNNESEIITDIAVSFGVIKRSLYQLQAKKMKLFEERSLRSADAVVFLTEEDSSAFPHTKLSSVIPPSVDIVNQSKYSHTPDKFLIFGSWSWGANLEGLIWFLNDVWIPFSKNYPNAVLNIIGGGLQMSLEKYSNVTYLGFKSDIELDQLIVNCSATLAPLFSGSGIKMKVLKSMASGVPIIGHKKAFQGIPESHPNVVCTSADDFIVAMKRLSQDSEIANSISSRNVHFAKQFFSEQAVMQRYNELFDTLLKK